MCCAGVLLYRSASKPRVIFHIADIDCCLWQVSVHDVDRGRLDFTTISGVVVDISHHPTRTTYRVATKHGLLKSAYFLGDLKRLPLATAKLMGLGEVLEHWLEVKMTIALSSCPSIGVRSATIRGSMTGGQGMVRCSCKGKCNTAKCSCFRAGRLCNSRCHKGHTCCNRAK